jgi:hypothetical protein
VEFVSVLLKKRNECRDGMKATFNISFREGEIRRMIGNRQKRKYFGEEKYVVDVELSLGQTKIYSNAPEISRPKTDVAAFLLSWRC